MEFEKLKKVIAEVLSVDPDEITLDTTFTDDLGADSLDLFQIIMGLEEEFDVEIAPEKAESIKTVEEALEMIKKIDTMGYGHLPICVAKTQYSFTDDPKRLGAPVDFEMTVNEVRLAAGAGFVVMICGKMMTMPGLPKTPAANNINVDDNGQITGLF